MALAAVQIVFSLDFIMLKTAESQFRLVEILVYLSD